jgi:ATP-dependent Clp protease protease subunit
MPKILKMPTRAKSSTAKPSGYRMLAKGATGEIYLYGVVGQTFWSDGVSATQFKNDLKDLGAVTQIDLRINSEGGDVFEGRTIYSLLSEHKAKIPVYVDGLAASIASLIAMAGDEIKMGDGTFMMIHNAWGLAIGNADEMRRQADLLESVSGSLLDTYVARTGKTRDEIKKWMDAETWMTAQECVDRGFATETTEPVRVAASVFHPEAFKNLPTVLRPNRAAAAAAIARVSALTKKS